MKKIVALVLSLVMALSLCTVAFAAGYDLEVTEKFGNDKHAKYDDLKFVEQKDNVLAHYEGKRTTLGTLRPLMMTSMTMTRTSSSPIRRTASPFICCASIPLIPRSTL